MDDYLAQALEIARAQATVRTMTAEEITAFALKLSQAIKGLAEGADAAAEPTGPAIDPKSSIRQESIICLVCGRKSRMLTKAHLAKHGLTPAEYKAKYGLKPDVNLVCKTTLKQQRERMAKMQPLMRGKASS
ncbi:MAG: MucR family transcriptional regulator [Desulfovibrio sp.]|jgi:predicted transcriptional regulator|nr:MucR family transcriptional regulator [Desulfovibrio sp.]